jgi:hypothetical protein
MGCLADLDARDRTAQKASSTHNFIQPFLVTETIEVNYTTPQRLSFEGEISTGGTDLGGMAECL